MKKANKPRRIENDNFLHRLCERALGSNSRSSSGRPIRAAISQSSP